MAKEKSAKVQPAQSEKDKKQRQSNDSIYKELMTSFLDQLIQTVFPELAATLDFTEAQEQQQEFYIYDKKILHGHKKFVDLLFEIPKKDQSVPKKVFIHIELEKNDSLEEMKTRMRYYFYLIDLKYQIQNLVPIVLFFNKKGNPGITHETVKTGDELFEVSQFHFIQWGIGNDQVEKWLTDHPLPLHMALAMHMEHPELSKVDVFLKALTVVSQSSSLNSGQEQLLLDYIDAFSTLEEKAKQKIYENIHQQEHPHQGVTQMIKRWSQRIAEQGMLEGEIKGEIKGKIEGKIEGEIDALVTVAQAKGITLEPTELELLKAKGIDQIKKALVLLINAQSKNDLNILFQS